MVEAKPSAARDPPVSAMSGEAEPSGDIAAQTRRMVRGDEAAWRAFYDLYFNRLLRYLLVLTNGREEAAREALQVTLLRVVRYLKPFGSEPAFWSWLVAVARSAVVDEARKRNRYTALLERFVRREPPAEQAADADLDARLLASLDRELAALPPGMLIKTLPQTVAIVTTAPEAVGVVHSSPDSFQDINDEQLLALLRGHPAVLIQRGPGEAELILINPADRSGFVMH